MRIGRWIVLASMVAVVLPIQAEFYNCYTMITPLPEKSIIKVIGRCSWYAFGSMQTSVYLTGEMTVSPTNDKAFCSGGGYCGMSIPPEYKASTTYTSTAKFKATHLEIPLDQTTVTYSVTTPDPINPHTTCPDFTTGCDPSPIIISLRGDYHLTSLDDGVRFDINADGVRERVSWTAAGSDLAFLAMDHNGNGRIDDGAELFGDAVAENGWARLAELDENGDGALDASDSAWRGLLLWYDTNHDGESAPAELMPLHQTAVSAISTRYRWTGRRDSFGNTFRYAADVTLTNGRREAYDVYFVAAYE